MYDPFTLQQLSKVRVEELRQESIRSRGYTKLSSPRAKQSRVFFWPISLHHIVKGGDNDARFREVAHEAKQTLGLIIVISMLVSFFLTLLILRF
jgi:hypothetical protein